MEMTIDIDPAPIAEKVVEYLDASDIAREVSGRPEPRRTSG